jgi:hypothetical protein
MANSGTATTRKYRVAVTATEDFPVSLPSVRQALKGVASIKIVPLPFRPLDTVEETKFAEMFSGVHGDQPPRSGPLRLLVH